jgi:hypothetical protein
MICTEVELKKAQVYFRCIWRRAHRFLDLGLEEASSVSSFNFAGPLTRTWVVTHCNDDHTDTFEA